MGDILAETETTFRFDAEERVLWICTTDPRTAKKWVRRKLPVTIVGTANGEPRSWEVKLDAATPGWRTRWRHAFMWSVPGWPASGSGAGHPHAGDEDPADRGS